MSKQHSAGFLNIVAQVRPKIKEITISEYKQMLADQHSHTLIDVREDNEWQNGHIKDAIHIGKGVIERDIEQKIADKTHCIVLYCGGGYRSALAAYQLQLMGYSNVINMDGGWRGWCEQPD